MSCCDLAEEILSLKSCSEFSGDSRDLIFFVLSLFVEHTI